MPKEVENPEDKYKGKFVAIDKDHPYFSIGNVSFTIQKGQVLPHPPFDVGQGVLKVFNSEKEARAYVEKYKDVLVEPVRGQPVTAGDSKGRTVAPKTFNDPNAPGRPDRQEAIDKAKQIDAGGNVTSGVELLTDSDVENILDQNARTVKSKLDKGKYSAGELVKIKNAERTGRKRISVVDYLSELLGKVKK